MQKEQLSALMDGEALDSELLNALSNDKALQARWQSYHLIRDTMRGDVSEVMHFDIAAQVAAAIEKEPVRLSPQAVPDAQPQPHTWQKMPFWHKVRPWASQITQVGVAACVSLAVIVGVQHYNQPEGSASPETPVFNTLPMMGGKASPVSFGVPSSDATAANGGQQQQLQEQRKRINAILQDYELQRRLHSDQLQLDTTSPQQAAVQVPGTQSLGMQSQ